MPSEDDNDVKLREVWDSINRMRMDVAEVKGMIHMHFKEGGHHHPPCAQATHLQKTLMSALFAAFLALLAAIINIAIAAHGS